MLLKSLEIQGFKSFPDKTKIQFGKGLTAVVGPNGSGKSNISDAVRWVMGEQSTKSLRGSKMEDVIFTGTKSRKSQGFAEVSLFIDNSDKTLPIDDEEVVVTRKYYRSGESEYVINRNSVRLRDINELFMDTGLGRDGYALVGQGRIAEIVQSKSNERREIFEEAAGISKYRYRKNESERKLLSAEDNLSRLQDILQELEGRIGPLQVQSEKAKRFLELSGEKRELEVSSWIYTLRQTNRQMKDHDDKILARQLQKEEIDKEAEGLEQKIQQTYDEMQQALVVIDELRREKSEAEQRIAELSAQIAVQENDILHNAQNQERLQKELESLFTVKEETDTQIEAQKKVICDLEEKIVQVAKQIGQAEERLLHSEEENTLTAGRTFDLNQRYNGLLLQESQDRLSLAQLVSRMEEEADTFANNNEILKQREEICRLDKEEALRVKSLQKQLEEKAESLSNGKRGYEMKWNSRKQRFDALEQEKNQKDLQGKELRQRAKLLQDLEKNLEGYAYSVKAVLTRGQQGRLSGIRGTVSQLIQVSEEYAVAIETALGGSLQNIVVDNEEAAKSAIQFLKRQNAGRATFLPITSVKGTRMSTDGFDREEGYVALASELVTCENRYQQVMDSLLGKIVIVEDLDTAVEMAKAYRYRFRIVTLDGQVVNAGGSMSGGSRNKSQGFFSRKNEIQKLEKEASALEEELQQKQEQLSKLEAELSATRGELIAIDSELTVIKEDQIRCEGEEKRLLQQIEQGEAEIARMKKELDHFALRQEEQQTKKATLQTHLDELAAELVQMETALKEAQSLTDEWNQQREVLMQELSDARYRQLELQKDKEAAERALADLSGREEDDKAKELRLRAEIEAAAGDKETILTLKETAKENIELTRNKIADLHQKEEAVQAQRNQLEGQTVAFRREEKDLSVKREQLAQELARFEERKLTVQKEYDTLIAKLWEEYQLTRPEAEEEAVEIEDIADCNRRLASLRAQIKGLGHINVAAIEEYQEVSERYEFLNAQVKDARAAKEELVRMIGELTVQMKELFTESFHQINTHFKRIFVELFGGGRAELRLTDEEDVLNSGIEIFVEPPGKIIKSLSLLSGGEQAFVAIAIYFAILKVRPAPFCILDEIEAALDDVNVTKYAKYLRLMSDHTQFIMITHRRGTMEEADVLYGVAMQEEGVSKLLQLNVGEIETKLGNLE